MASAGADEWSNAMTSGSGSESDGEGSRPSSQHKRPRGPGDFLLGRVWFVPAGSAGPSSPRHPRHHYSPAPTWKPQPAADAESSLVSKNTTVVNMMRLMNYEVGSGSGLGKHGQGITSPVKVVRRPACAGFGTVGAEGEGSYNNGLPDKEPETCPAKWGEDGSSQVVYDDWEKGDADGSRKQGRDFCEQILAKVHELQDGALDLDDGEQMGDAVGVITKVATLAHGKSASGELTACGLILEFTRLKEKFPVEYRTYCLANTARMLVAPLIGPVLQRWQPLWDPSVWLDVIVLLKNILDVDDGSAMSPYAELVHDTVVPAVQAVEWKATDSERMRRFLAQWEDTLPPSAVQRILVEVVMPELTAEVESWDPREAWQADCCHLLLRPWRIPLAGPLLESLCVTVRRKLEKALSELNDAGHALLSQSNLNLVSPWKAMFGRASWEEFVDGVGVVPRLEQRLRSLRITPPKQHDGAFCEVIMKWAPLVRAEDMVRLLEADFFGRWLHALRRWLLAAKPAAREAVEWCNGWGRAFTPELRQDQRVHARLEDGLAMVSRAAEGQAI